MKLVLDTSNRNPITLALLQESKAVALIGKATEGTSFEDGTLDAQREIAGAVKVPFGSYLFLHPDSKGSEAGFYLNYARPKAGDLQPIIDAEVTNLGVAELAQRANRCAHALEAEGYKPLLYASSSIWQKMIAAEPTLKRLKVWEAQYPGRFTRWFTWLAQKRIRLFHGVTVALWQWTDAYAVGGRNFDASALLVDLSTIRIPSPKRQPQYSGGGRAPAAE